jgi:hypothetical protein
MSTGLLIVWLALAAELPPWLLGAWTRDWIERKGVRTSVFDVHYLQTPTIFGDVRFPIGRPKFPRATSFADALDDGQSIGKRWLGIRVVDDITNAPCTFGQSFIRNLLLAVLGPIDWIFIFGERRQRLGDKAAGTIVVDEE